VWTLDIRSAVPAWRLDDEPPGVRLAFSTRRGGVSSAPYDTLNLGRSTPDRPEAVAENRRRLVASLGLDPERLATAGQIHGRDVTRVEAAGLAPNCDALLTRVPGLTLAVSSADCLPILFVAPGAVAAAHAGWRGTVAGVAEATLIALVEAALATPDRVQVHLGPCIRDCCYVVGPEVARQFPGETVREVNGELHLSLPAAVRLRLVAAGLPETAIEDTGACTACEPHWYFSHRRDRGATGRQWGLIARIAPA
jgi:purine-nucleoside/S-methyl-5'-thioadenosine phosphorylase / adenosine deaminase